jgi:hypothetical protein
MINVLQIVTQAIEGIARAAGAEFDQFVAILDAWNKVRRFTLRFLRSYYRHCICSTILGERVTFDGTCSVV